MADTPLMQQYRQMKKQYADMVLFFRLGDFYEMFDDDAVQISSILNLTLTHKGDSPMCGIPYHAAKNYIKRLLDAGKKIALCEQLELSDSSKSLAKREVVRVITPATVVDEDFLDDKSNNFIFSVFQSYCAYCDVSTGDFHLRNLNKKERIQDLRSTITQLSPSEILVCDDEYFLDSSFKSVIDSSSAMITKLPPWTFNVKNAYKNLCSYADVSSLASYEIKEGDKILGPASALVKYIQDTSKNSVNRLTNYIIDSNSSFVSIDESSRRNLELFNNLYDGSTHYSLFEAINRCKTSSGVRLLKNFISFPLTDIDSIKVRQDWVTWFYNSASETERIRGILSRSLDLNRLITRIELKRAVPHDLVAIKQSIASFFELIGTFPEKYNTLFDSNISEETLDRASLLMKEINISINDEFLGQFNANNVIKDSYDSELDAKRALRDNSNNILKQYLEEEKQNSGITILKLGYNRIFGYYLEVPKGQISKVPSYFLRKQTLVNGERFTTKQLQMYEEGILQASAEAEEIEQKLYQRILDMTLSVADVLKSIGIFLSYIDVFSSLAFLANEMNYVKPELVNDSTLYVEQGRHPVVERQTGPGKFIANDIDMKTKFALITGPNMAGKSTYLRQNALIILLAHIGSYVPASFARIGLVDKIFCRVGAMDNLARGESTFMLEMQETALILRSCTQSSFVIVDEIGRGTSTQDGMSIAYAVMKDLIRCGCRTLFATHYHELTMIDTQGIRLLTLDVKEDGKNIEFLRTVKEGVANSSYGIHVARLAGIPINVIKEAKSFQNKHFADYSINQTSLFMPNEEQEYGTVVYCEKNSEVINIIKNTDIDSITPVQAILLLSKLKEEIDKNIES